MELNLTDINPRLNEIADMAIAPNGNKTNGDQAGFILDRSWAKNSFMISDNQIENTGDIENRYWSTASSKFTDTRLGCNIGINSKPQFTRYSDTRVKGRLSGRANVSINNTTGNFGMGRYYSEAIDDPAQIIYLRFGVPQFNSLTNFLSRAFDPELTSLARTGRGTSVFYDLAKLAGTAAAVIAFPAIAAVVVAGKLISSLFIRQTSKFYTMKPTMHVYWSTVNTLVNTIAINKGIFPKIMNSESEERLGRPFKLDEEYISAISELMPDVLGENKLFDMYALANKAQRLANQLFISDFDKLNNGTSTDYTGYLQKELSGKGSHVTYISNDNNAPTFPALINKLISFGYYKKDEDPESKEQMELDPRIDKEAEKGDEKKDTGWTGEFFNYFDAEFRGGSQFASFRVDYTGPVSESFGNSVAESDLSQKLNSTSSQMRQARFSFADGNIAGGGALGEMVQSAIGAAKDIALGALDGMTMGFSGLIAGLGGAGYIDIPKHWQSSSASLPRTSYTLQLISPYGNAISQMQNIYIPLSMLLAGALPLSTGKQSYTSPFLCQLYDKGRCQVRLGMIESLSINRGVSNLAYDIKGNVLAIDVTFSVVDLSSIMHMPVSTGNIFGSDMTLDEDNILSDYLAVLAGQDIYSQIYPMSKAKLTLAKKLVGASKVTSPAYWNSMFHESATSGLIETLTLGSFNVLEGAARGTDVLSGSIK